ncbi:MAG: ABC transporter permease [Chloroflexota bacterium]|nr:ABC transporter permease [Chloroflexota bacterium]
MSGYIIRRIIGMIPLILGISFLVYALLNMVPGSPTDQYEGNQDIRPEDLERIRENLGLNEPWYLRYFIWLGNAVRLDFGNSFINFAPVDYIVRAALPNTLILSGLALLVSLVISIPIGVICAVKRNSVFDRVVTVIATAFSSIPTIWLALLMIILFAVKFQEWGLPSLPTGGVRNLREPDNFLDRAEHLILPVLALALPSLADWTRYIRSQMLEVVRQDYVRTAAAKGLRERVVLMNHAFRNALLPLVTLIGFAIPNLFGGALIIENVFGYPGVGQLTISSLQSNDYSVAMACVMMLAVLTVLGNLMADILYGALDPRVRYD